jgi:hypothetical protein
MVDAYVKGKRRQECRRGTQECVRHNDFNFALLRTALCGSNPRISLIPKAYPTRQA